jgi:hypothetical protein
LKKNLLLKNKINNNNKTIIILIIITESHDQNSLYKNSSITKVPKEVAARLMNSRLAQTRELSEPAMYAV